MLTEDEARALAVRSQGFGVHYAEPLDVLRQLGAIQLDSVNTVARSHELTVQARYGRYDVPSLLDRIYGDRTGFEYWGHSASWIDIRDLDLFQHRMARMRRLGRGASTVNKEVRDEHAALYADVLARIEAEGPLDTSAFTGTRPAGGWFNHKPVKQVLEDLYDQGVLMCSSRTPSFGRQYDLAARVQPKGPPEDLSPEAAAYELVIRSVARIGVGTAKDVAEYYRLNRWESPWREALAAAVRDGRITETKVDGWRGPAYADPVALEGSLTTPEHEPAVLSPLDNLLWDRPRVVRIFGFEHTFEIYKKPETRRYGYYVMPLLANGRLGGRADLKHDRQAGVLLVHGLWLEGARPEDAVTALRRLAEHLGANGIEVTRVEPATEKRAVVSALG